MIISSLGKGKETWTGIAGEGSAKEGVKVKLNGMTEDEKGWIIVGFRQGTILD